MGDPRGFLKIHRVPAPERDPRERTRDYHEIFQTLPEDELREQGARCMDCGIPFCHQGCPLGNLIPEWNDLVRQGRWHEAIDRLHLTNNFPEFTGLICPAPCEPACVLEINDDPVMIKQIELGIIERAWDEGWVVAEPPEERTGKTVAVVGAGPAGMAVAAELNKRGHTVTVFERDEAVGGLMRFGVPDHKMEKWYIDRRVRLLEAEGVEFRCGVDVGPDVAAEDLLVEYDALVVCVGARVQRELEVPGRELDGVHLAMDYLYERNRWVAANGFDPAAANGAGASAAAEGITARGKRVVVIGGGDTGADCISNAHREGAASVLQLDNYPKPPGTRPREIAGWPYSPKRLPSNYALDEGGERRFQTIVTRLEGEDGRVARVHAAQGDAQRNPVPGTEFSEPADLVLIAIGFLYPAQHGLLRDLGLEKDERGWIAAPEFATSVDRVFAAGDARMGQSLIVNAIAEGRQCARAVDRFLTGRGTARDLPVASIR
ncbi:MAG: glutamate synthase subunit beta [Actinomycetota bacterium]|nr:glutamate synthase subunit beta [Actinomycetota bacterium]